MMTERLKTFMELAEQLPPDEQERLIDEIEDLLDNAQWHALLADPRSGPVLDDLLAEAKRSPKRPWPTPADMGDTE
ncbi:MAG: hypothetical protein OJF49_000790 [Ktedonobacterales bacterium]|jgi:hypothetical protein|nr:MAG: hypothetical protein OJF49_000790 [Ktedonobacterales bacterium]